MKKSSKKQEKKAAESISIQKKIQGPVVRMVVIGMAAMGLLSIILIFVGTTNSLKQTLRESAEIGSQRVSAEMMDYVHIAYETGCTSTLASIFAKQEERDSILQQKVENYNIVDCTVYDGRKKEISENTDITSQEFYQAAMRGEVYISAPALNQELGRYCITIAAPLWRDGIAGTEVVGVVRVIPDPDLLEDIVRSIRISDHSDAFIVDGQGTYIANYDMSLVSNQYNVLTATDAELSTGSMGAVVADMIDGRQGIKTCFADGTMKYIAYAPIDGTDGWSLAIGAAVNDFSFYALLGVVVIVVFMTGAIILAVQITRKLSARIAAPIILCNDRLQLLAQGDLHSGVPAVTDADETGKLTEATGAIVSSMRIMIEDINYVLDSMANRNFNITTRAEQSYIGDFRDIILSIRKINRALSLTLTDINDSANQVASASEQMALGAQSLAGGATDQSAAIEELLATIENLTEQMNGSAQDTENTSHRVRDISDGAQQGNVKIREMTQAMENISDKSNQIRNVVTTIEDIATQTNLLSLNASIEAARAGEAGRGFAVVAGEIRRLAEQSEQAVIDTKALIEDALAEIGNGNSTVEETSATLMSIIKGLEEIADSVLVVSKTSLTQAESMEQVKSGVEQISSVVESNSATAQETSATSEELAAQAEQLNTLVEQFTLRKEK